MDSNLVTKSPFEASQANNKEITVIAHFPARKLVSAASQQTFVLSSYPLHHRPPQDVGIERGLGQIKVLWLLQ